MDECCDLSHAEDEDEVEEQLNEAGAAVFVHEAIHQAFNIPLMADWNEDEQPEARGLRSRWSRNCGSRQYLAGLRPLITMSLGANPVGAVADTVRS